MNYILFSVLTEFCSRKRQSLRNYQVLTDETNPQFKQILDDLYIKITYALSPQAKSKIERPYRWVQDNPVRTCSRKNIKKIEDAQKVLDDLIEKYYYE